MLALAQCWFNREHTPAYSARRGGDGIYRCVCRHCKRSIMSWDKRMWHLADGFNLHEACQDLDTSFLYLVDNRSDSVVARFPIDHLANKAEIDAYSKQIREDRGVDEPGSFLELRVSRSRTSGKRRAKPVAVEEPLPADDADQLTGMPGRGSFERWFVVECERARETGARTTIALVNIDRLDSFNRTHGLDAGDAFVRLVAAELRGLSDCHCHISRDPGLEFILIMPGNGAELASKRLDTLRAAIASAHIAEAPDAALSITCGLAQLPDTGDQRLALRAADLAVKEAKAKGGNAVVVAS